MKLFIYIILFIFFINNLELELNDDAQYGKNEFPELLMRQEGNMFTIKVPLKSILYKKKQERRERSNKFFEDINNSIVPKWNFIKSNVQNFANYYVKYILSCEPTKQIPLLDRDFFAYLIRICTVCWKGERSSKDNFDPSIKAAHATYMEFLKVNCKGYHNTLTSERGINDRAGFSCMLESMRNQLQIECTENFIRNYTKRMIKNKRLLDGDVLTKEELHNEIGVFLKSVEHLDIIKKFEKNVEFQRKMLVDLHRIQIRFENHIEEHKLNKTK